MSETNQGENMSQEMSSQKAKELLFEGQDVQCTQTEYHRDVRDSIIDFKVRCADLGKNKEAEHCQKQLDRLDKEHGLPPQ